MLSAAVVIVALRVNILTSVINEIKANDYDQEILQSLTADQPTVPRGRSTEH